MVCLLAELRLAEAVRGLRGHSRSAEGEASHAEETQEIGDNVEEVFPYLPPPIREITAAASVRAPSMYPNGK